MSSSRGMHDDMLEEDIIRVGDQFVDFSQHDSVPFASHEEIDVDNEVEVDTHDKTETKKRKSSVNVTTSSVSMYWDHYEKYVCDVENLQKARCKYCRAVIKADPRKHGTKGLINHYNACKKKPEGDSNQVRTPRQHRPGDKVSPSTWRFDQSKGREALCYMMIVDELPFRTVEKRGFRHFVSIMCPMFDIPSRRTLTKDVYNVYISEKKKLKEFIKKHSQRVSITTDTWTSIQRMNYMCLTAHFIDDGWNLHKRVLNFCPITGHKSEEVGKGVEKCLLDWGIDKIYTITVDNASSNDGAVAYLVKKFENWGTNISGGKYVHMRCVAHIINLIVQDGLRSRDELVAISRIRGAVRYVKNSPARYKRFLECVEIEKIETKRLLSLDVSTRWNSTFFMLESAVCLKRAFDAFKDVDLSYENDLSKPPFDGIPRDNDWERAALLLKFLEPFYKLTVSISGSSYVTSNNVFHEISAVEMLRKQWLENDDFQLSEMSRKMKMKFDKYWGSLEKMNMNFYYAVILDPRRKMLFLDFAFDTLYDDVTKVTMKARVEYGLQELFDEYRAMYDTLDTVACESSSSSTSSTPNLKQSMSTFLSTRTLLIDQFNKFRSGGKSENVKSELEKYLSEDIEDDGNGFDVLLWWKLNSIRFPILSKLARDVLAIPVSTVASESAFSTGGRVLDAFRSSLSPKIVQALICAQDWLRPDSKPISVEEDLREIEQLDQELVKMGVETTIVDV